MWWHLFTFFYGLFSSSESLNVKIMVYLCVVLQDTITLVLLFQILILMKSSSKVEISEVGMQQFLMANLLSGKVMSI